MRGFAFEVSGQRRMRYFGRPFPSQFWNCFRLVPAVGHFTAQGVIYTTRPCPLAGIFYCLLYITRLPRSTICYFYRLLVEILYSLVFLISPWNTIAASHTSDIIYTTYTRDSRDPKNLHYGFKQDGGAACGFGEGGRGFCC